MTSDPLRAAGTIQVPLSSISMCLKRCSNDGLRSMSRIVVVDCGGGWKRLACECKWYVPLLLCMADAMRVVLGECVVMADLVYNFLLLVVFVVRTLVYTTVSLAEVSTSCDWSGLVVQWVVVYGVRRNCPSVLGNVNEEEERYRNVEIHMVKSSGVGHSCGNLMVLCWEAFVMSKAGWIVFLSQRVSCERKYIL